MTSCSTVKCTNHEATNFTLEQQLTIMKMLLHLSVLSYVPPSLSLPPPTHRSVHICSNLESNVSFYTHAFSTTKLLQIYPSTVSLKLHLNENMCSIKIIYVNLTLKLFFNIIMEIFDCFLQLPFLTFQFF